MRSFYKYTMLCIGMAGLLLLTGCATMFGDKTQTLQFTSPQKSKIILTDGRGTNKYDVPGTITITKGSEQLRYRVDCPNSYEQKVGRDIAGVFWLNILSGGVVGSGIDYLTGSMWRYTSDVQVPSDSC